MTLRLSVLLLIFAGGCDCGAASHALDASLDAAPDADLPTVDGGLGCNELGAAPDGRVCIDQGWFLLSQWSPLSSAELPDIYADPASSAHEQRPVFLDAFLIDETEVTNADYAASLGAPGLVLPDCDGAEDNIDCDGCEVFRRFPMESSWQDGAPVAGVEGDPVRCVPKFSAEAYCALAGGRLPTVYEWMKAATGPYPASPAYPWGDEPPGPERLKYFSELDPGSFGPPPEVGSVAHFPAGASTYGVLDLAGSVSEFVRGCIADTGAGMSPLVRPVVGECEGEQLIAGSNWLSYHGRVGDVAFATALYGARASEDWEPKYIGAESHILSRVYPVGVPIGPPPEGQSWRVGFRCAYDTPVP